ncbi:hypothetical protein BGX38DRAFT_1272331 [Terfezia claveryi]|nr:hypothetical protein BGX38DRAFT_1272331 [Terfezia claveryi]
MLTTRRKPNTIQFNRGNQPTKEAVISGIGDLDLNSLSDALHAMSSAHGLLRTFLWLHLGLAPGVFDPESPTAFYIYWWVYEWRKTFKANQGKVKGKGKERAGEREGGGAGGEVEGSRSGGPGFLALNMPFSDMQRRDQGQQALPNGMEKGLEALQLAFEAQLRKRDEDQQKLVSRMDILALAQDTQETTMLARHSQLEQRQAEMQVEHLSMQQQIIFLEKRQDALAEDLSVVQKRQDSSESLRVTLVEQQRESTRVARNTNPHLTIRLRIRQ